MTTSAIKPTRQSAREMQQAFDWFNRRFFAGELPQCLVIYERVTALGVYRPAAFQDEEGALAQIGMNASTFVKRGEVDSLITLLHEIVHHWQHCFGRPPTTSSGGTYHNAEFADKMQECGVLTFNCDKGKNGKPPSGRAGRSVRHEVIPGGRFEVVVAAMKKDGWKLTYVDQWMPQKGNNLKTWWCPMHPNTSRCYANPGRRLQLSCKECGADLVVKKPTGRFGSQKRG